MTDKQWDDLVEPARAALEALITSGDNMTDRVEELEAKLSESEALLAKAVAQLEETNSVLTQTVGQRRHKAWATIRKTNNTLVELTGGKDE